MNLPPDFNKLVLEPEDTPITESFICACCEGVTQTAFGYVGNSVTGFDEKPTVYLADWMPTHAQYGVAVMVARGELQGDEAVNMRAMAFSFTPRPGGGVNLDLINAKDTRFAKALRTVFGELLSVSAARKDAELELFHAIAMKVLSEEARLKPFLLEHFAEPME
jgi:hypothetical protein